MMSLFKNSSVLMCDIYSSGSNNSNTEVNNKKEINEDIKRIKQQAEKSLNKSKSIQTKTGIFVDSKNTVECDFLVKEDNFSIKKEKKLNNEEFEIKNKQISQKLESENFPGEKTVDFEKLNSQEIVQTPLIIFCKDKFTRKTESKINLLSKSQFSKKFTQIMYKDNLINQEGLNNNNEDGFKRPMNSVRSVEYLENTKKQPKKTDLFEKYFLKEICKKHLKEKQTNAFSKDRILSAKKLKTVNLPENYEREKEEFENKMKETENKINELNTTFNLEDILKRNSKKWDHYFPYNSKKAKKITKKEQKPWEEIENLKKEHELILKIHLEKKYRTEKIKKVESSRETKNIKEIDLNSTIFENSKRQKIREEFAKLIEKKEKQKIEFNKAKISKRISQKTNPKNEEEKNSTHNDITVVVNPQNSYAFLNINKLFKKQIDLRKENETQKEEMKKMKYLLSKFLGKLEPAKINDGMSLKMGVNAPQNYTGEKNELDLFIQENEPIKEGDLTFLKVKDINLGNIQEISKSSLKLSQVVTYKNDVSQLFESEKDLQKMGINKPLKLPKINDKNRSKIMK